jgi:glycerol-3-phosphate dehydrogenase
VLNKNQLVIKDCIDDLRGLMELYYNKRTTYKMKSNGDLITTQRKSMNDAFHFLYKHSKKCSKDFENLIKA